MEIHIPANFNKKVKTMKVVHCLVNRQLLSYSAPDEILVGESVLVVETTSGYIVCGVTGEDLTSDPAAFPPIVTVLDLDDYSSRKAAMAVKTRLQTEIGKTIQSLLNGLTISELSERFPEIQPMVNELSDLPLAPEETTNARLA